MSDGKRPLGFVNRRGHNTDIGVDELSSLNIDSQPETATEDIIPDKAPQKKAAPRRPKRVRHLRWSRRRTVLLIAILLIVIIVPVVIGEALRAQYTASSANAQKSMQAIITSDVLPLQKKADITSKHIAAISDKIETVRDSMCPGGLLDNMASLYPRSKAAHDECIARRGRIAAVVTQERDMVGMLGYIESLNAALAKITAPSTDTYAVISNEQTSWQTFDQDLQKLNPPASFIATHQQLVAATASIADAWSKLNVASGSQNATDFQSAEKQLSDGYVAVRACKDSFTQAIADKQASLSTQVSRLQ